MLRAYFRYNFAQIIDELKISIAQAQEALMQNPLIRNVIGFTLVVVAFVLLQGYKLFYYAPNPENIWDNVYLWDWARHLAEGKVGTFVDSSHHLMRWGDWTIPTIFIWLTSDSVLTYFLSTIIPSSLGLLIFTWLSYRYIGFTAALVFVVLCFFDALLFRATFQLLPSGQGMLPIALMTFMALYINQKGLTGGFSTLSGQKPTMDWLTIIVSAGILFWVYGSKETHLALMPGFLWIVYKRFSFKPVWQICALFAGLYVIETIAFIIISPTFPWLGRVYSLINDGQHITIMLEHAHYVAEQTRYFDSGITMRWARTSGMTPLVMYGGFLLAILMFTENNSAKKSFNSNGQRASAIQEARSRESLAQFNYVMSVLFVSFIVFSTFFIISINPIRLGHGLVPRYATVGLPIAYLLIIGFTTMRVSGRPKIYAFAMLAIVPFFIAPSIDRFKTYPKTSITQVSSQYETFAASLKDYDCVRSRTKSIVMNELDLIPTKFRDEKLTKMANDSTLLAYEDRWFVLKSEPDLECQNMYTIGRTRTARY